MSFQNRPPSPNSVDYRKWGERLNDYLMRVRSRLAFFEPASPATEDGIIFWSTSGYPVVSKDGEYRQIVLADGFGTFVSNTDQTTTANTATAISWDSMPFGDGVSMGTPSSRIVFEEAGYYLIAFSVQITSSSSSTKTLYFWPRLNGTDVPNSTIKVSLHNNGGTIVMSRSAIFNVSADDYLEAYWATNDTNVTLDASAATAFAPATPSVILSVTRLRQ
jgi:hypothetical protein